MVEPKNRCQCYRNNLRKKLSKYTTCIPERCQKCNKQADFLFNPSALLIACTHELPHGGVCLFLKEAFFAADGLPEGTSHTEGSKTNRFIFHWFVFLKIIALPAFFMRV